MFMKVSKLSLLVGTDVEYFIKMGLDKKDAELAAASHLIGDAYGKKNPLKKNVAGFRSTGKFDLTIHNDNIMCEIGVTPVPFSTNLFDREVIMDDRLMSAREYVKSMGMDALHVEVLKDSTVLVDDVLATSKHFSEFGCMPDYCAYNYDKDEDACSLSGIMQRFAGGHIHLGSGNIPELSFEEKLRLIRCLDYKIYPVFYTYDLSPRMENYGAPGRFRLKSYGVEYRTPSNWWTFDEKRIKLIFSLIDDAIDAFNEGKDYSEQDTAESAHYLSEKVKIRKKAVAYD